MKAKKAARLHKEFFGREAKSKFDIDIADMKNLTMLGKVDAIEYTARKHEDKEQKIYRHSFYKSKPLLLTNGKELLIYGNFKINERGIV
jgi:hypothetical protein